MTDGRGGHHEQSGTELVERRRWEAAAAAETAGTEYRILEERGTAITPIRSVGFERWNETVMERVRM